MKRGSTNDRTRVRKGCILLVCAAVFLLAVWGPSAPALATEVCGSLFSDTTWTLAGSPYIMTCDTFLYPGYTLTIEPGVVIQFNPDVSLSIRGLLNAIGTEANRITFTSANPSEKGGGVLLETNLGGKAVIQFADFSNLWVAIGVECCWGVEEPANISNSAFRNNWVAVGGYAGNNIIIRNSTFENNECAVDSADKLIYDSVFRNNTYGLCGTERISVYNSVFEGNQVALYGGRGTVQNSTISGNGIGVQGSFEGFTLLGNTITSNDIGVILTEYDSFTPPVTYNNIFGNTTYNAKVQGSTNKPAPNNWWGTTDTAEIDAKIYDGRDEPGLGLLDYIPFLLGPVTAVPADMSVTKDDFPDPVTMGDTLTYDVAVINNGPLDATNVILTDTLPGGLTFVSATPSQGSCTQAGGVVTCKLGTLMYGDIAEVTIEVTPTVPGTITNTATVTGTEPDSDPTNNTAMATTTVLPVPTDTVTILKAVFFNPFSLLFVAATSSAAPEAELSVTVPDCVTDAPMRLLGNKYLYWTTGCSDLDGQTATVTSSFGGSDTETIR